MKIGLFFGSFNPVHVGHLIIAEHMSQHLDEVWMVVSPQNPFKAKKDLLDANVRLKLIQLCLTVGSKIKVCDAELRLPTPSYTYKTLEHLTQEYPQHQFSLIMGADNVPHFDQWKNYDYLKKFPVYVYPRLGTELNADLEANMTLTDAPIIETSSTFIRNQIKSRKRGFQYMLHPQVYTYIEQNQLYKSQQD